MENFLNELDILDITGYNLGMPNNTKTDEFLPLYRRYFGDEFRKKLQYNFPKMRGRGGVKDCSELFRKFIRFGFVRRPLPGYTVTAFTHTLL